MGAHVYDRVAQLPSLEACHQHMHWHNTALMQYGLEANGWVGLGVGFGVWLWLGLEG